ncbi:hypothetical protein WS68_24285 [Burkholderia sp. TSV86]|nr:hypothetical protein WS68_24285 [Burkholderia sp. TSV86]
MRSGITRRCAGPIGPELNRLTSGAHCDPLSRTPYHKYVPVRLSKGIVETQTRAEALTQA